MTAINNKRNLEIESRLTSLEEIVHEIRDNHLPHLAEDLKEFREAVDTKLDRGTWLAMSVLIGVLIDLGLRFVK